MTLTLTFTTALHWTALHYAPLHCIAVIPPPQLQLQWHDTNYTTPQLQLHSLQLQHTATTAALHHTTSNSCGWGYPCNHYNHSNKHNSNHLWVHQWIRSGIHASQQLTSPIAFQFSTFPPPPCAVLLVSSNCARWFNWKTWNTLKTNVVFLLFLFVCFWFALVIVFRPWLNFRRVSPSLPVLTTQNNALWNRMVV